MRNQEAERYSRMAALAAGLLVLVVAGVYLQRAYRVMRLRRALPSTVPSEVQQQSDNFSYSDVEQGRTIFTVRASHATQFKDQNRALLQDVWITVYGREGTATTIFTPANAVTNPRPAAFAVRGKSRSTCRVLPNPEANPPASPCR